MTKVDLASRLQDARARAEADTPPEDRRLAMFAQLTRKDARVRRDQDAALTTLAKTLMRRRPVKAERITENTLIRIAIDLLLAHAGELRGSTEDELRNSVTSTVPEIRTSEHRDLHTPAGPDCPTPRPSTSRASVVPESCTSEAAYRADPEHPHTRDGEAAGSPRESVSPTVHFSAAAGIVRRSLGEPS